MLIRFRKPMFVVALVCLVVTPVALARGDEPIRCDRRLPRDVTIFVSCKSAEEFRARWGQTALTKLVESDAFAEVRKAAVEWEAEFSQKFREQWGLGLTQLLDIPRGEIAIGLTLANHVDGKGIEMQGVVMIDFGDRNEAVGEVLEKLDEWARTDGKSTRFEEDVDDTQLILFRPAPVEEDANAPRLRAREPYGYFVRDTFLVLGSDAESLKKVLSRWDGGSDDVLAHNDVYQYVVERCHDENHDAAPLIIWYADPVRALQAGLTAQAQGGGMMAMAAGVMPALGINGLRGVGGTFDMAQGDYDMVTRTLLYLEQPARGVLSLLQFDAVSQSPPRWVTAESDSYFTINWNLEKAYQGVEGVANAFLGPGGLARQLQKFSQDPQWGNIHLKRDIIDQLTGTFHFVSEPLKGGDDETGGRYLVAAELKDAAAGRATLRKLAQFPGIAVSEREFQGETIFEIESGGADEDEDDGPRSAMGVAIAEGHLMFASDVKLLEKVLRGTEGQIALSETNHYRRVARRFPEKTVQISFNREDDDLKSILTMLQSGALDWLLGENADTILSHLPSFDTLKKSLPAAGGFMQTDDRGLKFTGFSLKADAE